MKYKSIILLFSILISIHSMGSNNVDYLDCSIRLEKDSLIVENSEIKRVYEFNKGNLITHHILNKQSGFTWYSSKMMPDINLPGNIKETSFVSFQTYVVEETLAKETYVEAEVIYKLDDLFVKRILRLYPECAAIANDFYFKGHVEDGNWYDKTFKDNSLTDPIYVASGKASTQIPIMEKVDFKGKHWDYKVVSLFEMTDHLNSLVSVNDFLAYKERLYKGNIIFAINKENEEGIFILKESPSSLAQLKYLHGDFLASNGNLKVFGFGIDGNDIKKDSWTKGYSAVTGLFSKDEHSALLSLKTYQGKLRKRVPKRDEMIMMNTWGDRGQDRRINEEYILKELELCSLLGITHFQIDDGWQAGKSPASVKGGSFDNIWERTDYWMPDKNNFPKGFSSVLEKGKKLGIEICLWFNPSYTDNYISWEKDADVLIGLYKKYGIRTFKIDGLRIHNKISDERVDSMMSKVSIDLNNDVVFNLDVTNDRRYGYLYKNEYGNVFLENRYTDFGNYYPYWTLRNLWELSKYVPAQNLQIEFLNKWRNISVYANDQFSPQFYDFEYLFAITMMGQPLAWMEAQNLPKEAFNISPVIKKYKEFQNDIHNGFIFPVGETPSGKSWTGFQSVHEQHGYFLIFREKNDQESALIKTWIEPGKNVELKLLLGKGGDFNIKTNVNGEIEFKITEKDSYSLYTYKIK